MDDLRSRLADPTRPLVGTVVTLPDVALAELTATWTDFVWIDLEHGALSVRDVLPVAVAARSAGAAALVRLRSFDDHALGAALDAGADGVVLPRVERSDEAETAVERLRHPPRGRRGVAARRASAYGLLEAVPEPVCLAQIESVAGVDAAEAIAAVDGVDALVVGCADLAADIGEDAGSSPAALRGRADPVRRACRTGGVAFGIAGPDDPDRLADLGGPGADLLVLGADVRIYAGALRGAFRRLQQTTAHGAPEPEEAHVGT